MAYIPVGKVNKYYDLSNEAEVKISYDGLAPGDYVRVGDPETNEYKVQYMTVDGKATDLLHVGDIGVINVNGEVKENDTVYKDM